jgi:hypothetical protein
MQSETLNANDGETNTSIIGTVVNGTSYYCKIKVSGYNGTSAKVEWWANTSGDFSGSADHTETNETIALSSDTWYIQIDNADTTTRVIQQIGTLEYKVYKHNSSGTFKTIADSYNKSNVLATEAEMNTDITSFITDTSSDYVAVYVNMPADVTCGIKSIEIGN